MDEGNSAKKPRFARLNNESYFLIPFEQMDELYEFILQARSKH
jgi:hypothetical protein